MSDDPVSGSGTADAEHVPSWQQEPDPARPAEDAEDPGYLTVTGEAAAEDGSVAEIIGGLPAVEGSAWDIGAPLEDRGAGLDDERDNRRPQGSDEASSS